MVNDAHRHIKISNSVFSFDPQAVEITVLDRRGHTIWNRTRLPGGEGILWDGLDLLGDPVSAGSYTCKIVYPDKHVIYVPFVLMR